MDWYAGLNGKGKLFNLYGKRGFVKCQDATPYLADEYDKPILDNITRPDMAVEMREGLKDLYSVIKARDEDIRFVFLTGVSIFSGLNRLSHAPM